MQCNSREPQQRGEPRATGSHRRSAQSGLTCLVLCRLGLPSPALACLRGPTRLRPGERSLPQCVQVGGGGGGGAGAGGTASGPSATAHLTSTPLCPSSPAAAAAATDIKSLGPDKWNLSYYPTGSDSAALYKQWYVIDAEGQTLGRLASLTAVVLRGKDQPTYTPSMDMGNYVIVINADKVAVTGNKEDLKLYHRHTVGRPGGWKVETLSQLRQVSVGRAGQRLGGACSRLSGARPSEERWAVGRTLPGGGASSPHAARSGFCGDCIAGACRAADASRACLVLPWCCSASLSASWRRQ